MACSSLCNYYFIFQSFLGLMPSIPLRYKAWKSEYVESIKEIAYKEEKQLFTTRAVGLFQEFLNLYIPLPTMFSASAVDSLTDLNWNDVQHIRNRNKCRNLGSTTAGSLLVAQILRLISIIAQDTMS